jgi:hypothetical protein
VIAILSFVAVASSSAANTTGLRGRVTIGPLTPTCSEAAPCNGPAGHVLLTFFHSGRSPVDARTDAKGWYRALLPAGTYAVHANRGMRLTPVRVVVRGELVSRRDFSIDTGIR